MGRFGRSAQRRRVVRAAYWGREGRMTLRPQALLRWAALILLAVPLPAHAVITPTQAYSETSPLLGLSGPVRLTAPDAGEQWLFGSSLAHGGQHVVIGARWADGLRGAAYLYEQQWTPDGEPPRLRFVSKLSGSEENRSFGWSVASSGNLVAVGAPSHESSTSGRGEVHLFDVSNGAHSLIMRIPAPEHASQFGRVLALSDKIVAMGDYAADHGEGAVYVFRRPQEGWSALDVHRFTKLKMPELESPRRFGWKVALDGETVFAGAPSFQRNVRGVVYVFEPPLGGWRPGTVSSGTIVASLPNEIEPGGQMAVFGPYLATTSTGPRDSSGRSTGAVAVFRRSGAGWMQAPAELVCVLTPSESNRRASFGSRIVITPSALLVAAPGDPLGGFKPPGAVYVFLRPETDWADHTGHEDLKIDPPAGMTGDRFGYSLAVDRQALFVGAVTETGSGDFEQGAVYLYGMSRSSVLRIPTLTSRGMIAFVALLVLLSLRRLLARHRHEAAGHRLTQ